MNKVHWAMYGIGIATGLVLATLIVLIAEVVLR